ncbi:hypothetical protein [Mammaliicoccus sciuri]|uniref:hypothetical protein n=1 Tax=Mammaliicoccus sciuri TaxID=1296 RepID=UPI000D1F5BCB|nr:hypothetical protein [Mammaliicoccus sciuri]PTJ54232.1 hypothetical protein BU012_01145 [Mammaliicoccus sciuri]
MNRKHKFVKPTYKVNGIEHTHPIERLEFYDEPENKFEELGINFVKAGANLGEALAHILPEFDKNQRKIKEAFKRCVI